MLFHEKIHENAGLYPESPAVILGEKIMTYGELDKRSDEIAAELSAAGVGAGDIVPVTLPRGPEWIAYAVGIMKSGAAYTPITPAMPPARREFILNDIKAYSGTGDEFAVYYTSGSTGEPKGVILSKSGAFAFCESHYGLCPFPPGTRYGVQADFGFDSLFLSMFPALYSGGAMYIMNDAERMSLVGIHRFLMKNKIETTFLTSSLAAEYMRTFDNKHLKTLFSGGEAYRAHTPRDYDVYNLYGPLESAVYVTAHKVLPEENGDIPIGTPTGQNRIYLIDGELCVSGPHLAIGYLNRPDDTALKFVANPYYNPETDAPFYRRMYRTGDMAEWSPAGELIYKGRIDRQVKISGCRIEPDEIEIALMKHPSLAAAYIAVKYDSSGEPFLAAYIVPREPRPTHDDLRGFLKNSLTAVMIPRVFIELERLPLNERTGKVEAHALPE